MRINMKSIKNTKPNRLMIGTVLLCTALSCTACGTKDTNPSNTGTEESSETDGSQNLEGSTSADGKPDTSATDAENTSGQNSDANNTAPENDTSVTNEKSNIRIEMHKEKNDKAANGVIYFYNSCVYPTVTIEGNMEAAEKINADIRSRIESSAANNEAEKLADELLDFMEEDDSDYTPLAYSSGLTFKTIRADSNVISFTLTYETFTGGAHGNYSISGLNYNAKTGDLLTLADLSDDPAAFREDTLAYNQKLAETEAYSTRMFSSEDITNGTLESVLYADNAWFLSTSGLVFVSDPYALGPYSAGAIEFMIPYSDLADMGFKESYSYSDRFVLKLQCAEIYAENETPSDTNAVMTYNHDLNGDGSEDSISLYREYIVGDDDLYETLPHLMINHVNLIQEGDDTIREQLTTLFTTWAEPVLYDLNVDDNYTELMFVSGESVEDDYIYYSHFFRYTKDNTLVYLGKIKGDATDPTVDTSELSGS